MLFQLRIGTIQTSPQRQVAGSKKEKQNNWTVSAYLERKKKVKLYKNLVTIVVLIIKHQPCLYIFHNGNGPIQLHCPVTYHNN